MKRLTPRFKVDENLPDEMVALLSFHGFDACSVLSQKLGGMDDSVVLQAASAEGRAVITLDLDLADVRAFPPSAHHGVIVLRLRKQSRAAAIEAVSRMLPLLFTEPLDHRLWVVSDRGVRIRG